MEYGSVIFAGAAVSDLDRLDKLELEAVRIITGATARCNRSMMLKEINWLPIKDRRENSVLTQLFQIMHNQAPSYLVNIFQNSQRIKTNHDYHLRNKNQLLMPRARLVVYKNSFFPYSILKWNNLPWELKIIDTSKKFKSALKQRCKTQMNANYFKLLYYGERWSAIHHCRLRIGCSSLSGHLAYNLLADSKLKIQVTFSWTVQDFRSKELNYLK
jgi:hypothetical protein